MAGNNVPGHRKGGGREKGTLNKRSQDVAVMLAEAGFDPDLPWLLWARMIQSNLRASDLVNAKATKSRKKLPAPELFYQGRELVSDGKDMGSHYEEVYAPATADMADKAAGKLGKYIRPELMRIMGTGAGGSIVVEFAENHAQLKGQPVAGARPARVRLSSMERIKPL